MPSWGPSDAQFSDGVTKGIPLSPGHSALSRVPPSFFLSHEKAVILLVEVWKQNQTLKVSAKQDRVRVCIRVWRAKTLRSLKDHFPLRHRACLLPRGLFINISIRAPAPLYFLEERRAHIRNNPWTSCFTFKGNQMAMATNPG